MATLKGKQLEVTVDLGGYYDTRIGFLDDASAERIRKGEDFDSVIEEFSGTHPHSSESAVVGTYIVQARNLDDIVGRISCKVGNKKVPFSVVALAVTEDDSTGDWDGGACEPTESGLKRLGGNKETALQLREEEQQKFYEAITPFFEFPKAVWATPTLSSSASHSAHVQIDSDEAPEVLVVFYTKCNMIPWGDELLDKKGKPASATFLDIEDPMYLGAIIVDGKSVPFETNVGSMILPKRLLIIYRKEDARVEVRC